MMHDVLTLDILLLKQISPWLAYILNQPLAQFPKYDNVVFMGCTTPRLPLYFGAET